MKEQERKILSRRQLGSLTFVSASLGVLNACAPEISRADGASPESKALGRRIQEWTLPNGARMSTISPELNRAGRLYLVGKLDKYISRGKGIVEISYVPYEKGKGVGAVTLTDSYSKEKEVYILARWSDIKPFEIPLISSITATVRLVENLKGTRAELAVAAKEASQITDYLQYCRVFREMLEAQGASFTLVNPTRMNISKELVNLTITHSQIRFALDKNEDPWFRLFVDVGSFLRVGAIAYANWFINYPEETSGIPEELHKAGQNTAGLLQHEGLINREGNKFVWTKGHAPELNSKEFVDLLNKLFRKQ